MRVLPALALVVALTACGDKIIRADRRAHSGHVVAAHDQRRAAAVRGLHSRRGQAGTDG
jgi:hypothetical protein